MITPELQTYIRQQLGAGIAKEVIKQNLSVKGWNPQDLDDAFFAIENEHTAQTATPPAVPSSHKGIWATVIILLLLLLGAAGAYAAYSYGLIALPTFVTTTPPIATTTSGFVQATSMPQQPANTTAIETVTNHVKSEIDVYGTDLYALKEGQTVKDLGEKSVVTAVFNGKTEI